MSFRNVLWLGASTPVWIVERVEDETEVETTSTTETETETDENP